MMKLMQRTAGEKKDCIRTVSVKRTPTRAEWHYIRDHCEYMSVSLLLELLGQKHTLTISICMTVEQNGRAKTTFFIWLWEGIPENPLLPVSFSQSAVAAFTFLSAACLTDLLPELTLVHLWRREIVTQNERNAADSGVRDELMHRQELMCLLLHRS